MSGALTLGTVGFFMCPLCLLSVWGLRKIILITKFVGWSEDSVEALGSFSLGFHEWQYLARLLRKWNASMFLGFGEPWRDLIKLLFEFFFFNCRAHWQCSGITHSSVCLGVNPCHS